jgi:CRP-like cAMP-binding protein
VSTGRADPLSNCLLAGLPREEYDRLRPGLEIVSLGALEVIAAAGEPLRHVYFPLTGVISLVATDADGATVEAGTIGKEGKAGLPAFLGVPSSPMTTMGQIAGDHARLPVADLLAAAAPGSFLNVLLHRYAQALFVLAGQSAACNRLHPIEERCARWLLMTQDRVGTPTFPLTHEVLGQMLGVRRASVTIATGTLQRAGLIAYHRGEITILDRAALEAGTCECYGVIQGEFARLLGAP